MLQNIEAVLFDLDGSLVDSMWIWRDIDIAYLQKFKIAMPEGLQAAIEGMSFSETAVYFKETFHIPDSLEQIKEEWTRMAWDKYASQVPLKKGADAFIAYCVSKDIRLGIATSNSRALVENVLKVHGLLEHFAGIVTACDVSKGKPAPDVYLEAARRCQAEPAKCLVFEDIVPGILAGKAAGMKVCAVADEYSLHQSREKRELAD
ncbi:MAG: HAD family phosphatase, partial [Lachnospiraceae bacterium]|nr:HAD family phosphatase [Lachnospiraceae bacterium]